MRAATGRRVFNVNESNLFVAELRPRARCQCVTIRAGLDGGVAIHAADGAPLLRLDAAGADALMAALMRADEHQHQQRRRRELVAELAPRGNFTQGLVADEVARLRAGGAL